MFGDLGGSIFSAASSLYGGIQARNLDRAQFDRQMAFADEQSRTQYQRAVADMKAAGINPMLAVSKGGNAVASAPGWSGASNVQGQAASAAINARLVDAQVASAEAAARKTNAEANVIEEVGLDQAKATLDETTSRISNNAVMNDKIKADTELSLNQIVTERERPAQIRALVDQTIAMTKTEWFRQLNLAEQNELLQAQTKYWVAHAKLEGNQVAAEELTKNARRIMEQGGPAASVVKGALDTAFDWFGGKAKGGISLGRRVLRGIGLSK